MFLFHMITTMKTIVARVGSTVLYLIRIQTCDIGQKAWFLFILHCDMSNLSYSGTLL
jgi:hypothetical protein